eukprot:SAG11_NODE_6950_length_1220_cov_2.143622_1_plen_160_part_00
MCVCMLCLAPYVRAYVFPDMIGDERRLRFLRERRLILVPLVLDPLHGFADGRQGGRDLDGLRNIQLADVWVECAGLVYCCHGHGRAAPVDRRNDCQFAFNCCRRRCRRECRGPLKLWFFLLRTFGFFVCPSWRLIAFHRGTPELGRGRLCGVDLAVPVS